MAKAENFEVSEEEYTDEIKRMAEAYRMEEDKLTEMISDFEEKAIREDLSALRRHWISPLRMQ